MKIFISCDMEGITGVAVRAHTSESSDYLRFRKLMTADVNAAIEGAAAAGATEFLVTDSHGPMTNILVEELDPRAELITGSNKYYCQVEGLDASYTAAFFLGYHGREGAPDAVINHTLMGVAVTQIRCNGREVGETGINAGLAGHYGVPVALVSGDDVLAQEARDLLGDVETAVVKRASDRWTARLLPPKRAHEVIRQAAERATRRAAAKELPPYRVAAPVTFEIEFKTTDAAHMAAIFPFIERTGAKTIRVTGRDYPEAFRLMWGSLILGSKTMGGVL